MAHTPEQTAQRWSDERRNYWATREHHCVTVSEVWRETCLLTQRTPKSAPGDHGWCLGRRSWEKDYMELPPPSSWQLQGLRQGSSTQQQESTEMRPREPGPPKSCRNLRGGNANPLWQQVKHVLWISVQKDDFSSKRRRQRVSLRDAAVGLVTDAAV